MINNSGTSLNAAAGDILMNNSFSQQSETRRMNEKSSDNMEGAKGNLPVQGNADQIHTSNFYQQSKFLLSLFWSLWGSLYLFVSTLSSFALFLLRISKGVPFVFLFFCFPGNGADFRCITAPFSFKFQTMTFSKLSHTPFITLLLLHIFAFDVFRIFTDTDCITSLTHFLHFASRSPTTQSAWVAPCIKWRLL